MTEKLGGYFLKKFAPGFFTPRACNPPLFIGGGR